MSESTISTPKPVSFFKQLLDRSVQLIENSLLTCLKSSVLTKILTIVLLWLFLTSIPWLRVLNTVLCFVPLTVTQVVNQEEIKGYFVKPLGFSMFIPSDAVESHPHAKQILLKESYHPVHYYTYWKIVPID